LTSLILDHTDGFEEKAMLVAQAATLVELDLLFPIVVLIVTDSTGGFHVPSFPCLKRLTLRSVGQPIEDGHVLDFTTTFPALESLSMDT
jgi:hypothetical protein